MTADPPPARWPWRAALLLTYVGGLVALTAPAWWRPGLRAIGHPDSDVWRHLWGDAWFARELGGSWPVPLSTDLLWFPDGGLLYNLDPLTGLAVWPLAPLVGLVTAHNLVQLGALLAGAVAAYLLARRWFDGPAAAVAGAVYGFSAHLQGAVLASGIGETAHVAWIPLALLALVRITDGGGWRWVPLGGVSLAVATIGSWYYGLVAGLAAVGWVVGWAARALVARGRADAAQRRTPWIPILARLAATAALAGLVVMPFANAFRASLDPERALHDVALIGVLEEDLLPAYNVAVATLRDFVVPGEPRVDSARDRLALGHHPGFVPLLLALAALLARRPGYRVLTLAALATAALTMGPWIHLDAETPLAPNPVFRVFASLAPGGGMVRNLERLQVGFTICLALLAAGGAGWLLDLYGLKGRLRAAAGLALVAVVIADACWVGGHGFPLPTAEATIAPLYRGLADGDERFAILELPHTDGPGGRPFWHQTVHGRPLPYNFEGQVTPSLTDNPLLSGLIPDRAFHLHFDRLRHGFSDGELEAGRQALVGGGFRYAMVTDRPGDGDLVTVSSIRRLLERAVGPPVAEDPARGLFLYDLRHDRRR